MQHITRQRCMRYGVLSASHRFAPKIWRKEDVSNIVFALYVAEVGKDSSINVDHLPVDKPARF